MSRTSTQQNPAGAVSFTARARHLLAAGRANEVVELCTLGLARSPDNVSGYLLLVEAYRILGESERARNVLADGVRRTRSARLRKMLETEVRSREQGAESDEQFGPGQERGTGEVDMVDDEVVERAPGVAAPGRGEEQEVSSTAPAVDQSGGAEGPNREDAAPEPSAQSAEKMPAVGGDVLSTAAESEEMLGAVSGVDEVSTLAGGDEVVAARSVPDASIEEVGDAAALEASSEQQEMSAPTRFIERPVAERAPEAHAAVPAPESAQQAAPDATLPEPAPASIDAPSAVPDVSSVAERDSVPERAAPGPPAPAEPLLPASRASLLSLHVRTAPAPKLRSSNLRLIPGLEFAPLRHEEPQRQRQIAALIDEAMPEPSLPELAHEAEPATAAVDVLPPMPAFTEAGDGVALDSPAAAPPPSVEPPGHEESAADERAAALPPAVDLPAAPLVTDSPAVVEASDPPGGEDGSFTLVEDYAQEVDALPSLPLDDAEGEPSSDPPVEHGRMSARRQVPATSYRQPAADNPVMTPLEELARKLESARIPIVEESNEPPRPVFEPSLVSDTIAEILVKQGAWAEAMKAFQMLARMKPGRHAHYQERIREMRERIAAAAGPPLPDHPPAER